jgi:hypothetical protein
MKMKTLGVLMMSVLLLSSSAFADSDIKLGLVTSTAQEFGAMVLTSQGYVNALKEAKKAIKGRLNPIITTKSTILTGHDGGDYKSAVVVQIALLPASKNYDGFVRDCFKGVIEATGTETGWEGGVSDVVIDRVKFRTVKNCGGTDPSIFHPKDN